MRRSSLVLACSFVLAAATLAAAQDRDEIAYGVKAGLNAANHAVSTSGLTLNLNSRVGIVFGGFAEIPLAKNLKLQPELLFSMKGSTVSANGGEDTLKLNYLEVPILARYNFALPGNQDLIPFVYGGPSIGLLVSAHDSLAAGTTTTDTDVRTDMSTVDLGLAFGGGVQMNRMQFEIRYTAGLTNIISATAFRDMAKARNNTISFLAGYRFSF